MRSPTKVQVEKAFITAEVHWLINRISACCKSEILQENHDYLRQGKAPKLTEYKNDALAIRYKQIGFSEDERLVLALALLPELLPEVLINFQKETRQFCGGIKQVSPSLILPTIETALFLLGGIDLIARMSLLALFKSSHAFYTQNLLNLGNLEYGEPKTSATLIAGQELLDLVLEGEVQKPDFNASFPAKLIQSSLDWDDLILHPTSKSEMTELIAWLKHHETLMHEWGMKSYLRKGYRCLFYGPSGTGKTMAAGLLGKRSGRDVYRIDLSMVVSKYIGETEKNLSKIFDRAEHKNWILFFDEADALFGKRTAVNHANDRYANQEVSFLLQRIEDYDGLVILSSNLKSNIDDAFLRRFQSIVPFPMPTKKERFQLWMQVFPKSGSAPSSKVIRYLAERYELSGGAIRNISSYATLMAIDRQSKVIRIEDLEAGVRKELEKEGRII